MMMADRGERKWYFCDIEKGNYYWRYLPEYDIYSLFFLTPSAVNEEYNKGI